MSRENEKFIKICSFLYLFEILFFIQSISKRIGFLNIFDQFQEKMRNLSKCIAFCVFSKFSGLGFCHCRLHCLSESLRRRARHAAPRRVPQLVPKHAPVQLHRTLSLTRLSNQRPAGATLCHRCYDNGMYQTHVLVFSRAGRYYIATQGYDNDGCIDR